MDAIAADPTYGEAYIQLGDVYKVRVERESLAAPGAFAGTAAIRCDVPSLGQSF